MKNLYRKLAIGGISKNLNIYVPFGIAYGFLIMVYNILVNISTSETLKNFSGMSYVQTLLWLGQFVMILFSVIFLVYADNYIMKKRRMEFGLYNVLGLEKKQISKIVVIEILIIGIASIVTGILLSLILNKLVIDLFFRIIKFEAYNPFIPNIFNSLKAIGIFSAIGIVIIFLRVRDIYKTSSIELFTKSRKMEGGIIPTWIKAALGVAAIGAGYYIAITVRSPFDALTLFLVAVMLVIVGTYWAFSAISTVVLNLLKMNKNFYYKTNNFVAISGLRQRIRQNSDGLASICIMSCAALVLLGSGVALYFTADRTIGDIFPRDLTIRINYSDEEIKPNLHEEIKRIVSEKGGTIENEFKINYSVLTTELKSDELKIIKDRESLENFNTMNMVFLIDANDLDGYDGSLNPGEAWYFSKDGSNVPGILIEDLEIKTVKKLSDYKYTNAVNTMSVFNSVYFFVEDLDNIKEKYSDILDDMEFIAFDVKDADSIEVYREISNLPYESKRVMERSSEKAEFMGIYGSVFFVGIFLGFVFIIATGLVIYYKQLSEGYEDRYRFKVYRNVGMTEAEVKKSIFTQVKTIFFLPPITAGIHIAVAFGTVSYLLTMIGLFNIKYKIMAFVGVYVFYLLVYGVIYKLTSNSYYKIISE
ncbi:MAG: ABC transporter permease [Tissierellia bacterium]|nr:ABC transporter permease [Tissierellia bacterium]